MKAVLISILLLLILNLPLSKPVLANIDGQEDAVILDKSSHQIFQYDISHCQRVCCYKPVTAKEYGECVTSCVSMVHKMGLIPRDGDWYEIEKRMANSNSTATEQQEIADRNTEDRSIEYSGYIPLAAGILSLILVACYFGYYMPKDVIPSYENEYLDSKQVIKLHAKKGVVIFLPILFCADMLTMLLIDRKLVEFTVERYYGLIFLAIANGIFIGMIMSQSAFFRIPKAKSSGKPGQSKTDKISAR